ncbi:MAG: sigma-70 family RNA polymerase sigma factor [Geminicoccaceae bacterium]|nr:sigma-70 family RNA polymerase sigma factor [Geminicoccaceae bacterium]
MSFGRDDLEALLPQLRRFARGLTAGDTAFADDLVQDTVVAALEAADRFTAGTNLRAWLFTILRNRFFNLRKRRHRTAEVADDVQAERIASDAPQEGRLELLAFKHALAALRPEQREALLLTTLHDMSIEAAAEICRCRPGTIKSRVNRGRRALKLAMAGSEAAMRAEVSAPAGREEARLVRPRR